jgi:hypothetical protein
MSFAFFDPRYAFSSSQKVKGEPLYLSKEVWAGIAKGYRPRIPTGSPPRFILGPLMGFNAVADRIQELAWQEGAQAWRLRQGAGILDVGYGAGRWFR